jgi:S1-C subfamily serine protease
MIDPKNNNTNPPPTRLRQQLHLPGLWLKIKGISQFAAGIVVALLALMLFNALTPEPDLLTEGEVRDTIFQVMASATAPPPFSAQVYQIIQPSLVLIQTNAEGERGEAEDGLGSGVVINDKGDILTSLHVVDGADEIHIIYADGTRATGEVVASEIESDIAVLASDHLPEVLVPAILGNPNVMHVGDEAYVVGNPFGLYSSVSAGVISGFGRSFQPEERDQMLENLIQVDAAVNPGNSGGPLLNRFGQVIGIVVGIINPTEDDFFIGIGFAVPIDVAGSVAGIPPY